MSPPHPNEKLWLCAWTPKCVSMFTNAHSWSLSNPDGFNHCLSESTLIFSYHLCLSFSNGLSVAPSQFPNQQTLNIYLTRAKHTSSFINYRNHACRSQLKLLSGRQISSRTPTGCWHYTNRLCSTASKLTWLLFTTGLCMKLWHIFRHW